MKQILLKITFKILHNIIIPRRWASGSVYGRSNCLTQFLAYFRAKKISIFYIYIIIFHYRLLHLLRKFILNSFFQPAHVTIYANALGELSEDIVMSKVQNASGSKSHVK